MTRLRDAPFRASVNIAALPVPAHRFTWWREQRGQLRNSTRAAAAIDVRLASAALTRQKACRAHHPRDRTTVPHQCEPGCVSHVPPAPARPETAIGGGPPEGQLRARRLYRPGFHLQQQRARNARDTTRRIANATRRGCRYRSTTHRCAQAQAACALPVRSASRAPTAAAQQSGRAASPQLMWRVHLRTTGHRRTARSCRSPLRRCDRWTLRRNK